jgi:hypothetical protein
MRYQNGDDSMQHLNPDAVSTMYTKNSLSRIMRRFTQGLFSPIPANAVRDLGETFPDEWKHLRNSLGQPIFLLINETIDNPDRSNHYPETSYRVLVFGTVEMFTRLANSLKWFMDGTFQTCPEIFFQLFIIHILIGTRVIPCLYCFLERNTTWMYTFLFECINQKAQQLNIDMASHDKVVKLDFEDAIRLSIHNIFPHWTIQGCYFHYCQAIYKYVCVTLQKRLNILY